MAPGCDRARLAVDAGVVSEVPLLPGPLYGLRTWRVVVEDGRERLTAPQRGTDCRCGIHAWHPRPTAARRVLASRFDLPGIVEVDGAVEVHDDGFRAARARPYAFVRLPGRNPFLIERLGAIYGAEVLDLRRPDELLAICRERGLGLPEPVVVDLIGAEAFEERRRERARMRREAIVRVVVVVAMLVALCVLGVTVDHAT
jgi:hypothetical protein